MSANERQVGGNHYKVNGEEHWDRVARLGLDYFQGQITKYVERWKKKNGIEDLKKAQHFLQKYIELEESKPQPAQLTNPYEETARNRIFHLKSTRGNSASVVCGADWGTSLWSVDPKDVTCPKCKEFLSNVSK